MIAALPRTEAAGLFNRFFGVDAWAQAAVWDHLAWEQAAWRLRRLDRRLPNDFVTKVSLAGVMLRLGRRAEADDALSAAHALRRRELVPAQSLLAILVATLGRMDQARQVLDEIIADPTLRVQAPAVNNAAHLAFLSGDVAYLTELARLSEGHDDGHVPLILLDVIQASGLADRLEGHQDIVRAVIGPAQCWIDINIIDDGDWPPMIALLSFLQADPRARRRLKRDLVDRLSDFYEASGKLPGAYIPHLGARLIPLPECEAAA
jgi:hypothetical protein